MTKEPLGVLVTWVSVNHQAAPLIDALGHPRSLLFRKIGRVVLCYRNAPKGTRGAERELAAVRETVQTLRKEFGPSGLEVVKRGWKTEAPPTDHAAIKPFAEQVLREVRARALEVPIYIHVSPGTPAMHAVWLVLASTGFIANPVHIIQGIGGKDRSQGEAPVSKVDFPLDTWLRRYRRQRPSRVGLDDGQLWDPSEAQSPPLQKSLELLRRYAPLRVPVLLIGERGTGKTTLAGQLRAMSPFQGQEKVVWPVVVCGQFRVNPQLARSELFGHKKGAFTGATTNRKGLLEQANGDTIFFDEIGDIDRDTQRLLMAAVEGRGFTRLGDSEVRCSRFRLVFATNRPLRELRGGLLDEDFYDRIAVFIVRVPSLRECREDLPALWSSVLHRSRESAEVAPGRWRELATHPELLEQLSTHPLHGNLRDLQKLAYHALAALEADLGLDAAVREGLSSLDIGGPNSKERGLGFEARLPLAGGLDEELARVEARWLSAALAEARGNRSEAARLLGLARKTFADRVRRRLGGEDPPPKGG